ncbi:MAG: hypothetical protein AVDCRST_MAG67-337, partial [uncultured Solirubrobacteraceae bacterium]
ADESRGTCQGRRAGDPPAGGARARRRPRPRAVRARVRPAPGAREPRRSRRLARGALPPGLGRNVAQRRPLVRRLRPQAAHEARACAAAAALHPHARRLRLSARSGAV